MVYHRFWVGRSRLFAENSKSAVGRVHAKYFDSYTQFSTYKRLHRTVSSRWLRLDIRPFTYSYQASFGGTLIVECYCLIPWRTRPVPT